MWLNNHIHPNRRIHRQKYLILSYTSMQYITSYEHYGQKKAGVLPADGGPGSFDQPKDVTCHTHIL